MDLSAKAGFSLLTATILNIIIEYSLQYYVHLLF
jgi:hypothetical protein